MALPSFVILLQTLSRGLLGTLPRRPSLALPAHARATGRDLVLREVGLRRLAACCIALCVAPAAFAQAASQADAGLLTELRGNATYQAAGGAESATQPLMKLRVGDRLRLPAATSLKLVYFKSATAETWRGPASFVVGEERSEQTNGAFTSTALPGAARAPVELTRIANLNRIGAVVVRGIKPPEADISQARQRYNTWRAEAAADDLLPDLYLYAVLKQYGRQAEMQALAAEMLKRAPDSAEAHKLARENPPK